MNREFLNKLVTIGQLKVEAYDERQFRGLVTGARVRLFAPIGPFSAVTLEENSWALPLNWRSVMVIAAAPQGDQLAAPCLTPGICNLESIAKCDRLYHVICRFGRLGSGCNGDSLQLCTGRP